MTQQDGEEISIWFASKAKPLPRGCGSIHKALQTSKKGKIRDLRQFVCRLVHKRSKVPESYAGLSEGEESIGIASENDHFRP